MANVTLNVTDAKGQATGTVEAPEALFGVSAEDVQAHIPLIHQVVTAQLAAARQGTHATKTRGMVPAAARSRGSRRHRSCSSGLHSCTAVVPRWHRVRSAAA